MFIYGTGARERPRRRDIMFFARQRCAIRASSCTFPQDMLGFNVTFSELAAGQAEAYYSIASCSTPNNVADRGCGPQGPDVAW